MTPRLDEQTDPGHGIFFLNRQREAEDAGPELLLDRPLDRMADAGRGCVAWASDPHRGCAEAAR